MAINLSTLNNGSNPAEWFIIINSWSEGFMMSGILVIVALIVFGIAKKSGTGDIEAFLGTSFAMFIVSLAGWFVRFDGLQLVPTFLPVFFLFMAGLGALFTIIGPRIFNNN